MSTTDLEVTRISDLLAVIVKLISSTSSEQRAKGRAGLAAVVEELTQRLAKGESEFFSVIAWRRESTGPLCMTLSEHESSGRARTHVYQAKSGELESRADTHVVEGFCVPGLADGLPREIIVSAVEEILSGVGDGRSLQEVRKALEHYRSQVRNAEENGFAYVCCGARLSEDGLQYIEPLFTSSDAETGDFRKRAESRGARVAIFPTSIN